MDSFPLKARIGILGGMGPRATHYFVSQFLSSIEVNLVPKNDQDYPSFIVNYASEIPDRTEAILANNFEVVRSILRERLSELISLGCTSLLIPCVSAHAFLNESFSEFPIVDIRHVTRSTFKSLRPCGSVGVLATKGARISGACNDFIPDTMALTYPAEFEENRLMSIIYQAIKNTSSHKEDREIHRELSQIINSLKTNGASPIIAGCTEIEMVLSDLFPNDAELIYPLRLTAAYLAQSVGAR